jgi:hypothetical protein
MSIIRAALRQCAIQAVKDKTWAQNRVYDSDNKPLLEMLEVAKNPNEEALPFIVIYTDADNHDNNTMEHGVYASDRSLVLTFEIGMASAIMVGEEKRLHLPHTDPAMELGIDMLQAQVMAAVFGDRRCVWAELVRTFLAGKKIRRINSQRGGTTRKSAHWAARQVMVMCDVLADPVPGATPLPPTHALSRFIATCEDLKPANTLAAAQLIKQFLTMYPYNQTYASWEQAQQMLGLTLHAMRSTGQAPVADLGAEGTTPYATDVPLSVNQPDGTPYHLSRIEGVDEDMLNPENFIADENEEESEETKTFDDTFPPWPQGNP